MSLYSSSSRASSYYSSSRPSSSILSRTTSHERSNYSSPSYSSYTPYSSRYSSTYSASSKPPRPSYSSYSASESYRSRIGKDSSPARSSYSRNTSETRELESDKRRDSISRSISSRSSDSSSRYSSSTISSRLRDSSTSRDSGYGSSRVTSRDRSLDYKNGNGLDAKGYGPTASSYASNYRWEGSSRSNGRKADQDDSETDLKLSTKVSNRIKNYETPEREVKSKYNHLQASSDEMARLKREEERLAARRERLGLSNIEKSRSRTPDVFNRKKTLEIESRYNSSVSRECNGNDSPRAEEEEKQSVSDLRRKYDTCNGYASRSNDENDNDTTSKQTSLDVTSSVRDSPLTSRRRNESEVQVNDSLKRRDGSDTSLNSIRRRTDSESSLSGSRRRTDSDSKNNETKGRNDPESKLNETSAGRDSSPYKSSYVSQLRNETSLGSTNSSYSRRPDSRNSSLTNGSTLKGSLSHLDDPACAPSSPTSPRGGVRRGDRVRERVAARLAREVEDPPPSPTPSLGGFSQQGGLVGLRNIGNTCFLNSVVQCLSNTRALMEYLVHERYLADINTTTATMKGELVRAFAAMLGEMWREGDASRAVNTQAFKAVMQRFCPMFVGFQQHDAQEFLRQLLNGLDEDVNRVTVRPRPVVGDIPGDLSDDQIAMESWKRMVRQSNSTIADMFVGQLKSCLACSHCSHRSVTFDPFWDLSLSIPPAAAGEAVCLTDCFDFFTEKEILDGDNRPKCERCGEKRRMSKTLHIQRFPRVLVLHLMRFSPTERWRGKLSRHVQFPIENFDLSHYASNTATPSTYSLVGVANHSGTTYSGHYTATCRHPYSGDWHLYNDSRVQSVSQRKVCSPEGYLLFYELKGSL